MSVCWQCRTQLSKLWTPSSPAQSRSLSSSTVSRARIADKALPSKPRVAVLLHRAPLLTRELHPFEKAYFLYQKRLNERLALPFTRYFYYGADTPEEKEWKRKIKVRRSASRDVGVYSGYGQEAWNDEALVGDETSDPARTRETLLADARDKKEVILADQTENVQEIEEPKSRRSKADEEQNLRSLSRKLSSTLYLVVKRVMDTAEQASWSLPSASLLGNESLHRAAERLIVQSGGINMNTWVIGNAPLTFTSSSRGKPLQTPQAESEASSIKTFFMKARILAGQAEIKDNKLGVQDFQWLDKHELAQVLPASEYAALRDILPQR